MLLLRWGLRSARQSPCGGGEPSPLPPIGDSRKKNNSTKISCWNLLLLLLLSPAAVGASLRSPMRLSGSPAAVAAAAMPQPARPKAGPTKRQQHSSTTKEQLLWGGASLRSPMRLSGCCCRATRTPDQQHSSTTKEQLLWGGASLRSPMRLSGEESRRRPNSPNSRTARTARTAEQPEQPNSRTARTAEQLPPLPSASPFPFPVRFRRLPRPAAVYHSAVLRPAALLFFRRRRPPPAPFICGRWLGSISATDGHGIIFPAAKIGFSRLRSLTFPPCWSPTS